jgi:hypothetical protein
VNIFVPDMILSRRVVLDSLATVTFFDASRGLFMDDSSEYKHHCKIKSLYVL